LNVLLEKSSLFINFFLEFLLEIDLNLPLHVIHLVNLSRDFQQQILELIDDLVIVAFVVPCLL
jgi:hypothetical protein